MARGELHYNISAYRQSSEERGAGIAKREAALNPAARVQAFLAFLAGEQPDSVRFQALSDAAEKRRLENHVNYFNLIRSIGGRVNEEDEARDRRMLRNSKQKVKKSRKDPAYKEAFDLALRDVIDPFQRGFVDYYSSMFPTGVDGRNILINHAIVTLQTEVKGFQKPVFIGSPTDEIVGLPIVDSH